MIKIGRFLRIFLLFSYMSTYLFAGDISISASLDRDAVYIDDTVQLTIKISGSVGNLPDPDISSLSKDFQIVGSSTSTSISVINGSFQAEKDLILQLKPLHAGLITIKDIYIKKGGKKYYINPVSLKVIATYQLPATSSISEKYSESFTSYSIPPEIRYSGIGVIAEVNKKKVYVGEELLYRFIFINRISLMGNPSYSPPQFKGVWKYDLLKEPITKRIIIDGYRYQIQELRTALIPLSPGRLIIPPARLEAPIDFFTGNKVFHTRPIEIEVYPLPETGRTNCFTGAVGDGYKVKLKNENVKTEVDNPFQIELEIIGPGNLNLTDPPPVHTGNDFKYFKPQVNDSIVATSEGTIVDRNITYIFQPLREGKYTIGPIKFCYFSPTSGYYKSITAGSVVVTVLSSTSKPIVKHQIHKVILRAPVSNFEIVDFPGKVTSWLIAFFDIKWLPFIVIILFFLFVFLLFTISRSYSFSADERKRKKELQVMEKQMLKLLKRDEIDNFYRIWKNYFKYRWGINVDIISEDELIGYEGKILPTGSGKLIVKINEALHNYQFADRSISAEWKKYAEEFIKRVKKWES